MDLFEYQGKQYFARFGIPVSPGGVADSVDEAVAQADKAGYPVVVKAQVQVGGRGKAGGIKLADDAEKVREHASNILGMDIKGHVVRRLWIERASDIDQEYYASFTLDRSEKKHLGMLSAEGGVEIEQVADTSPEAIARLHVDPVDGLSEEATRKWVEQANLDPRAVGGTVDLLQKLYRCFVEGDADLVEINPLILTPEGKVHALDAKVTLDDSAAFRHPEWDEFRGLEQLDPRDALAKDGIAAAVVSLPCWELFEAQPPDYRAAVLGTAPRVAVEAAVRLGWDRWLGERSAFVGMSGFGASAPVEALYPHFGITAEKVAEVARSLL